MNKKQKRNLEVISRLDDEIVEKASQERSNLLLALKRRIKKMWLIRGGAMAASLALIATTVLLVVLLAKEVPVYTGMTVSNTAPTAAMASVTLPDYLDPGNGNGNAYGNKHLNGDHTDADKTIGENPFENPIDDAVGAFRVESAEPRYYAKPNEDVYITVHIDNPDDFVILSFTLNGKMYSSYMFEEGSDLENLILKVNVGDVEGVVSYTIDAIKYVDGTKIKDVKIGGDRTVEIGVYTENQPAAAFSDLLIGYNSISFAVDVSDTINLFETLTGSVEAVLYDGESIVARKEITATGKTEVTFDGLTTGALYECAIIATYDALDGEGITRHILSTHAAYTKAIVLFDEVEIGTTSVSFGFLWDEAFANKTVTGLALYQNDTKIRDIDPAAVSVGNLVPGTTYMLVATYPNGSASEQIRITFTTDALFVTVNQYLEELDGTYTLLETVTEKVTQGTVYTPALGSYEGFTTPTVAPVTMTDTSHAFECYFERTAYEVTVYYNSAQGIANESIKFGKPLATPVRDGFAFGGWYLDADLTTPAGDTVPAKAISVYAKWLVEATPTELSYKINGGKVTITGLLDTDIEELVIPAYIGGYPVTAIGSHAFDHCTALTSVTIPSSVATIGSSAFNHCTSLASIELPSSVTAIEYQTFWGCTSIASVEIPDGVATIAGNAFADCTSLASITIPDSVTTIGDYAFSKCTALTSITIPDSVTTIGYWAFRDCTSLTSITIPDSVTTIGERAFENCTSLSSITVENGNTTYHSKDNCLIETASKTLVLGCKSSVIPSDGSVTAIGEYAFADCTEFGSIELPNCITTIGESAFSGCTGLTSIEIPDSVTTIGENAFSNCTGLESITIPDNVTEIGNGTFSGCTGLASITLPFVGASLNEADEHKARFDYIFGTVPASLKTVVITGGESIAEQAFCGCTGLESITLPFVGASLNETDEYKARFDYIFGTVPASLKTVVITGGGRIVKNAFSGCTGLESITLPDSILSIGISAFSGCTGLTSITVPSRVRSIAANVFDGCEALASIILPDGVTTIANYAFRGCAALTSITLPDSVTTIANYAFRECTALTSITIPTGVTKIGNYAFEGCTALSSITIPSSVGSIGTSAFRGCVALTSIMVENGNTKYHSVANCLIETATKTLVRGCENSVIPTGGSVTSIGEYAFDGCTGLTSITLPDSVTTIGNYAFRGCTALTSITIPEGVTAIESGAFSGCTTLANIIIPSSVTAIGGYAFYKCTALTSITIPDGVTAIEERTFDGCTALTSITIPDSVTTIGGYAFHGCAALTSITIPDGVTAIEERTFDGCTALTSITIPDSVTTIGKYAFYRCITLTSITLPDSITTIGNYAFRGCIALTSVTFANTEGWKVNGNAIAPTDLADASLAATYLSTTYLDYEWKRS